MNLKIMLPAFVLLLLASAGFAICSCGTLSTPNSICTLAANQSIAGANCYNVTAQNVTIDCAGFSIKVTGTAAPLPIAIYTSQDVNITVKNCAINSSGWGIYLQSGNGPSLNMSNSTIYADARSALVIAATNFPGSSSRNNLIKDTRLSCADYVCAQLLGISSSTISNISVTSNAQGMSIGNGTALMVANSSFAATNRSGGVQSALSVITTTASTFTNLTISSSTSDLSSESGSNASSALQVGPYSRNNTFSSSRISSDGAFPALFYGSPGNTFASNTLSSGNNTNILLFSYNQGGTGGIYNSTGNVLYWNNFSSAGIYHIIDKTSTIIWLVQTQAWGNVSGSPGINFYNATISGKPEGNIYDNVMSKGVIIWGSQASSGFPSLYIGNNGTGYPYGASTSQGRISGNATDYAPLTPLNSTNIYPSSCVCGVSLIMPNYVCNVTQNLNSTGTCFNVQASNVTIQGNGFSITGTNATGSYGVYSNQANTTIKNCVVSNFSTGISLFKANGSSISNVTIISSLSATLLSSDAMYLSISNSRFNSTLSPNGAVASTSITGNNSNITNTVMEAYQNTLLLGGANSIVRNCTLTARASIAINLAGYSSYLTVANSYLQAATLHTLYMWGPSYSLIANNTIRLDDGAVGNVLETQFGNGGKNNTLANNTFIAPNGATALGSVDGSMGGYTVYWNDFTNVAGTYCSGDAPGTNFSGMVNGQLEGNIYSGVLSGAVQVFGTVASSGFPGLYIGSSGSGYPYNNVTSFGKFNCTNSASNKGTGDFAPLTPNLGCTCGVLSVPNYVCALLRNQAKSNTCFTVAATNVTISCAGFSITGTNASNTYGIYSNRILTSVKDCALRDFSTQIYFNGTTVGTIQNTTANTTKAFAGSDGYGIAIASATWSTVANSTISSVNPYGLYVNSSSNTTIIGTTGISTQHSGSQSGGIFLYASPNNTIYGSHGIADAGSAIYLSTNSSNNSISGSQGDSQSGSGIYVWSSRGNAISGSSGTSSLSHGIYLLSSANSSITGSSGASSKMDGILVSSGTGNVISGSSGTSTEMAGIALSSSSANAVANSTASTVSGTSILLSAASGSNVFANNTLVSGNAGANLTGNATLLNISQDSAANTFYWNNFTATNGTYVLDQNGSNYYNATVASYGSDMVRNGNFSSNSYWSAPSGCWAIAGGVMRCDGTSSTRSAVNQDIGLQSSSKYLVSFDLIYYGRGWLAVGDAANYLAGDNASGANASGHYIYAVTSSSDLSRSYIYLYGFSNFNGSIDNFTIKSARFQNEGNIYANVINGSVVAGGESASIGFPGGLGAGGAIMPPLYVSSGGSGFPYGQATSKGKFICNSASCADYAPLSNLTGCFCKPLNVANAVCNLTADQASSVTCFPVTAQNVTINCAGHFIVGNNSALTSAITSVEYNTTIRDCVVRSYPTGISLTSAIGSHTLSNNNVVASDTGIFLANSGANNFTANYGKAASGYGIYVAGVTASSFARDIGETENGSGFYVTNSPSNNFTNISGISTTGNAIYLYQGSSYNRMANPLARATGSGTGMRLDGSSYNNVSGMNASSYTGDAVYLLGASAGNNFANGTAASSSGNGISIAQGATGTTIYNVSASSGTKNAMSISGGSSQTAISGSSAFSSSGTGIYLAAASYVNITNSSCASNGSGYGLWAQGSTQLVAAGSSFSSSGPSGLGAAAYFETGANGNTAYDNVFFAAQPGYSSDLLSLFDSSQNLFYHNTFNFTNGYYAREDNGQNTYNATIDGKGEGNLWYNVLDGEVKICGAYRPSKLEWESMYIGSDSTAYPKQYPYNSAHSKGKITGSVVDYAPTTPDSCWLPQAPAPKNASQMCQLKSCNIDSDCMSGDAPYCDAGCNQLSHTCYPCVGCGNAYCLPAGQACGDTRSLAGCGAATCNSGVCTGSGATCPGAPGLACCPSSFCSSGVCVAKKAAGEPCGSASECSPSAPYCSGGACSACLPVGAPNCTSNAACCNGGLCNLASGTSGFGTCMACLGNGDRTCSSSADCCPGSNLTCKEGACAVNHPPAPPLAAPVLGISTVNGSISISCIQNCFAASLPPDPDRDTPVRMEYKWFADKAATTAFWHTTTTLNCELLPGGCQSVSQITLQSRACDKYGACSAPVESLPVQLSAQKAAVEIACSKQGCTASQRCCSGYACKYASPQATDGACYISSPLIACTDDSQCLSGMCRPTDEAPSVSVCVNALSCGQSCSDSPQCPSGCQFCADGFCSACIPAGSGAGCTDNSQCCAAQGAISGVCSDGLCKECADPGASCSLDSECCSGRCQDTNSSSVKVCAPTKQEFGFQGAACLQSADCSDGLFCDLLNRGGRIGVAAPSGNGTIASDFGQCTDAFAPYTRCNPDVGKCSDPYSCTQLEGSNDYYCLTNQAGGTQFFGWVKVGGIGFEPSSKIYHSGTTSAMVSGGSDASYAYNSVLMGSLEGEKKYLLSFWAFTERSGALARYAIYDSVNDAYLSDGGQWLYSEKGGAPNGGIIGPKASKTETWVQNVKAFKTLPGAKVQLRFYPLQDGGAYYIDDVAVDEANDFSMLAWVRADASQPGGELFSQVSYIQLSRDGAPVQQGINWSIGPDNALSLGMYSSSSQQLQDGSLPDDGGLAEAGSGTGIKPGSGGTGIGSLPGDKEVGTGFSIAPQVSLADGKWHQVALSVDRTGNYSAYLDGALAETGPFTLGSLESNGTFYIGGQGDGGFAGELGEVRFYKRSLTPADVLDHYNGRFQQACKISLAFAYNSTDAENLTAAYNADLKVRKLLPDTILSMPFDVNISSDARGMIVDYSRFLGSGTKTGAVWTPDGQVGGAYTFNGEGDSIVLPSPLIFGTGDFTVSAWVNLESASGTRCVLCSFSAGNQNGLIFGTSEGYPAIGTGRRLRIQASMIKAGKWVHLAAVRKNGMVAFYVNGAPAGNASQAFSENIGALSPLAIGNTPDASAYGFSGKIDEVRAFSRALTGDEIAALYSDNALTSSQSLPLSQN